MSFAAIAITGATIGAIGSGYNIIKGAHQQKEANKIHPEFSYYQANPYAADQLSAAQNLYNGRMAGAASEQNNIASSQANFANNASRNASSGAQALALAAAGQGEADSAYNKLGTQESQNKVNMLQNLNQAYAANINEGDKVYQSQLNKYQLDLNRQAQLAGAGASNISGGINGLGSSILAGGNFYAKANGLT